MMMDPMQMSKQVVDFNKRAFGSSFTAASMMQDNMMKAMDAFMNQSPLYPAEAKNHMAYWMKACTDCREKFKMAMDDNFAKFESWCNGHMGEKTAK